MYPLAYLTLLAPILERSPVEVPNAKNAKTPAKDGGRKKAPIEIGWSRSLVRSFSRSMNFPASRRPFPVVVKKR